MLLASTYSIKCKFVQISTKLGFVFSTMIKAFQRESERKKEREEKERDANMDCPPGTEEPVGWEQTTQGAVETEGVKMNVNRD